MVLSYDLKTLGKVEYIYTLTYVRVSMCNASNKEMKF